MGDMHGQGLEYLVPFVLVANNRFLSNTFSIYLTITEFGIK
jgi:hypothetical protein